jgi:hypothetical protein
VKRAREDEFIDDFGSEWEKYNNDDSFSGGEDDSGDERYDFGLPVNNGDSDSDEEAPNPALIQTGPRIQINAVGGIANLRYIGGDPVYTPSAQGAGGELSTVVLGPGGYVSTNSDADRSVIPEILQAELAYPAHTFKAGHLLNAEFGGSGSDAANLTILTTAANSAMRAFDNAIKNCVITPFTNAYTAMNNVGIDVTTLTYGIQLTITTNGGWWAAAPGHHGFLVTTGVTCVAAVVNEPTVAGLENTLTGLYGANRVPGHANLMAQLVVDMAAVQSQVAAATAAGVVNQ